MMRREALSFFSLESRRRSCFFAFYLFDKLRVPIRTEQPLVFTVWNILFQPCQLCLHVRHRSFMGCKVQAPTISSWSAPTAFFRERLIQDYISWMVISMIMPKMQLLARMRLTFSFLLILLALDYCLVVAIHISVR
jgi:hypothetical protein